MPNHVTNVLKINGTQAEVDEVKKAISNIEGEEEIAIDFNKIIPMPSSMNITSGSNVDFMLAVLMFTEKGDDSKLRAIMNYPWVKAEELDTPEKLAEYLTEQHSDALGEAKTALDNIDKYGAKDWYDWSIQHWGTKWNAYNTNSEDNVISFETAWSSPNKVIKALSKMFPRVKFELSYADEDFGYNCGEISFLNGAEISINIPVGGSVEAYKIAINIQGDPDDCGDTIERIYNSISKDYISGLLEVVLRKTSPSDVIENVECFDDFSLEFLEVLKEKFLEIEAYEFIASIDEKMKSVNVED